MQTHNTTRLLNDLQVQTTAFLNEAIQKWQMMPDEKFSRQPSPAQWSAKQCLAHLNSYGNYYIPAISNAVHIAKEKGRTPVNVFTPGWLGNYFTQMMQTDSNGLPVKKIKAFKKYIHPNNEDGDEVIATFIEQQEKMLLLIEAAKQVDLRTTKVGISIAPFISLQLGDVLLFITAHTNRHCRQAARAAESIPADHTNMILPVKL